MKTAKVTVRYLDGTTDQFECNSIARDDGVLVASKRDEEGRTVRSWGFPLRNIYSYVAEVAYEKGDIDVD